MIFGVVANYTEIKWRWSNLRNYENNRCSSQPIKEIMIALICVNINLRISFNSRGSSFVRNYQSCTQIDFIRNLSDRVNLVLRQRSFSFVVPITEHLPLNSKLDYKYQNDIPIFWQEISQHFRYFVISPKRRRKIFLLDIKCRHKLRVPTENVSRKKIYVLRYVGYVCR